MLDKIDRKLLALLQQDCTLSLQALAEAVNLTTTPCWKRLKRLEDDGILIGKVALLDPEKIGLGEPSVLLSYSSGNYPKSTVSVYPPIFHFSLSRSEAGLIQE